MRTLTIAAVAALALAGCGTGNPPAAGPVVPPPVVMSFGQTHTWPTGDQITVANPRRDQISSTPGGTVTPFLALDVTFHNGTQVPEPVGTMASVVLLDVSLNDIPVGPLAVSDPQRGDTTPAAEILPGRTVTYRQTFQMVPGAAPARLQVQVSGSMGDPTRPPVFYEGTA
jgi:hypothetical protein